MQISVEFSVFYSGKSWWCSASIKTFSYI